MLWGACRRVPRLGLGKDACVSNGDQVDMISGLAMKRGPSVDFCGYWQRAGRLWFNARYRMDLFLNIVKLYLH